MVRLHLYPLNQLNGPVPVIPRLSSSNEPRLVRVNEEGKKGLQLIRVYFL